MNVDVRNTLLMLRSEANGSDHVFNQSKDKEALYRSQESVRDGLSYSGIRDLHWHDLRHTFGTRLAEAGCSEATIASLMGHSDPQTTRRYTHATDRAKRAAVEAVCVLRENVCHKSATTAERLPKWQPFGLIKLVGTARFELATSRTPSRGLPKCN